MGEVVGHRPRDATCVAQAGDGAGHGGVGREREQLRGGAFGLRFGGARLRLCCGGGPLRLDFRGAPLGRRFGGAPFSLRSVAPLEPVAPTARAAEACAAGEAEGS